MGTTTIDILDTLKPYRVVGLDMTGSEKKASGFALVEDGIATTMRLKSDSEIIEEIVKIAPDIIAMDSLLSLPQGRISIYDDDPGRYVYGINRECERLLLKRGIRSYPPLIKSMQQLTLRGITLAGNLKEKGFLVIETYPGAIQDTLKFPRKQKDLNLLRQSLKDFGFLGSFSFDKVTHDEIDALTCCIAGLYYLYGKYELLGNDAEGYLVLPDLET
jgi:predicted nuclease with RNAse H fold